MTLLQQNILVLFGLLAWGVLFDYAMEKLLPEEAHEDLD